MKDDYCGHRMRETCEVELWIEQGKQWMEPLIVSRLASNSNVKRVIPCVVSERPTTGLRKRRKELQTLTKRELPLSCTHTHRSRLLNCVSRLCCSLRGSCRRYRVQFSERSPCCSMLLGGSWTHYHARWTILRPHPVFWRFAFSVSIAYELILIFILFQTPSDARKFLKFLDEDLGEPIPEKDYGGNCYIYDPNRPDNPYHNIREKVDVFIFAHFFGYWCKTLIFRDWWLTTVISVMFEFLEYSLEHQLPNFSECWWDHWILDVFICNGGGTVLGLFMLKYLSMKEYNWRGLWDIPTYRGKIKRIIAQFSPHGWIEFTWNPLSSLERWLAVLGIIAMFLVTELNTFYLKFVLWFPPEHWLNFVRLFFILLWGAVCLRETFQLLDDPECDKLGRQSWVLLAVISTELLVCLKFGWDTMTKPIPKSILLWWLAGIVLIIFYTFVKFVILKPTRLPQPEKELCDRRHKLVVENVANKKKR
ncbi:phosphatidylserine synthase 2-like [Lepeophtheirus salmonis]|uniref:phosphatidylserine synthase 2-like n=1 Tax=Lepeophtheirus salmonis TaxID=72036 RepID=UPI001AE2B598|nr:phosphatidylserine synthase 2-like [Lepeophtheirus salmonis]XP_040582316.1 phosphatidylserine synthase 2-like [Lepeophtheirus salmonis]XP_040582317.1 phosphatidylserine synthase 2-like [Lepeophtheirus salmonis]